MLLSLIIVELLILFAIGASVEADYWFLSVFGTIVLVGAALWFFAFPPIHLWVFANWLVIFAGFFGWFLVGGVTAIAKWNFFIKKPSIVEATKESYDSWKRSFKSSEEPFEVYYNNPISLNKNYSRILHWIAFWPAVWFWSCTYKLVYNVCNFIYNTIKNILISITTKHIENTIAKNG